MNNDTVAILSKKSADDLVGIILESTRAAQSWAVRTAKAIIALIKVTGSEAAARAALKKAKLSECHVKNAMQLVWAYQDVVAKGHASEAWFDELLYVHAVAIRRAIAKVGVNKLVSLNLFTKSPKANLLEFELIGDTGLGRAERLAADEAKAEREIQEAKERAKAEKEAAKTAKTATVTGEPETVKGAKSAAKAAEAEETLTESAAAPKAVSLDTSKPKSKEVALKEFDTLLGFAEKFIGAVAPTADDLTLEAMRTRVAALMSTLDAAAKARKPIGKRKLA